MKNMAPLHVARFGHLMTLNKEKENFIGFAIYQGRMVRYTLQL